MGVEVQGNRTGNIGMRLDFWLKCSFLKVYLDGAGRLWNGIQGKIEIMSCLKLLNLEQKC